MGAVERSHLVVKGLTYSFGSVSGVVRARHGGRPASRQEEATAGSWRIGGQEKGEATAGG